MVKPVSLPRLLGSLTSLALLLGGTTVLAQQVTKPADSDKPESEEAVFIPIEYRTPPWQVSVGVRISGKAKVKFSNLGFIPNQNVYPGPDPAATAAEKETDAYKSAQTYVAAYGRTYDDGAIYPDSTQSLNSDGTTYTKVEPTDGKTNYWNFTSASQIVDLPSGGKALALHAYAVNSDGAEENASKNSSLAWDIEVSRELGSNRRMSWGLLFGAGISDINCKTGATIKAKLHTLTDYYSLEGVTLPTDYSNGTSYLGIEERYAYTYKLNDDGSYATDASGYYIPVYMYDVKGDKIKVWTTAERIQTDPNASPRTDEDTASLDVVGHWEVKGAYMTARFGPYFAYQLAHWLAVRASAGLTFTVIGADFRVDESAYIPAKAAYMSLNTDNYSSDPTVSGILGYFASGEVDAFLTNRTGVFLGASHESFQRDIGIWFYGHRADISLSSGTVLRTGITTRF